MGVVQTQNGEASGLVPEVLHVPANVYIEAREPDTGAVLWRYDVDEEDESADYVDGHDLAVVDDELYFYDDYGFGAYVGR